MSIRKKNLRFDLLLNSFWIATSFQLLNIILWRADFITKNTSYLKSTKGLNKDQDKIMVLENQ